MSRPNREVGMKLLSEYSQKDEGNRLRQGQGLMCLSYNGGSDWETGKNGNAFESSVIVS